MNFNWITGKSGNGASVSSPGNYGKGDFKNILTADAPDSEIVANVKNKRMWFMDATRTMRRQWLINAAFARGQQFSILHRTEDRIIDLVDPGRRKQVTDDMIGPWREHMVANMVTATPAFEVIPSSLSTDAVQAARTGSALLSHYYDDWRFSVQYIAHANNILNFGNSFEYLNYIEDGSRMISEPAIDIQSGQIALSDDGSPLMTTRIVGDVTGEVLLPHSLICPVDAYPLDTKPWIIIQVRRELDHFRRQYENGGDVRAEEIDYRHEYDLSYINGEYYNRNLISGQVQYANELIYFQKPQSGCPDGMVAVVAGDVLLQPKESTRSRRSGTSGRPGIARWPYKNLTSYPVVHFHWLQEPGEFFARSPIERQIPIQKDINLAQSIIAENMDEMAHLKWLLPMQGNVSGMSDANDVVRYIYPFKPEQTVMQPMPAYVAEYVQSLKASMRDAQNYHGASMGGSVSGVRSDAHAQNLQDQDLLPLTVVDELIQSAFESMGEKILLISAEKLDTERIITYVGKDKRLSTMKFKGVMLADARTVKVRLTNKFMRSKVAAQNNIMQMFQMGMVADQYGKPDPNKAMRLLEFSLPDSVFLDMQIHTDRAYAENDRMLAGELPPVTPWQNHTVHLDVHQAEMNGSEFMGIFEKAIPGADGTPADPQAAQIAQIFQMHTQQHEQYLMQAMGMFSPPPDAGQQNQQGQASGGSQGNPAGKGQSTQQA